MSLTKALRNALASVPALIAALITFAAMYQANRASVLHRAAAQRMMQDYGAFAAMRFRKHLTDTLDSELRNIFLPVSRPGFVHAADWLATLESKDNHPRFVFAASVNDSAISVAGETPSAAQLGGIAQIRVTARRQNPSFPDFALFEPATDSTDRLLAYKIVADGDGTRRIYGFEFGPTMYTGLFATAFAEKDLLPQDMLSGFQNNRLIALEVVTPNEKTIFSSGATPERGTMNEELLGPKYGGLEVRAGLRKPATAWMAVQSQNVRTATLFALLVVGGLLTNIAFNQARRARELSRMRTDFVASVSHELRTPLAQVQLFLETLRLDRYETNEQREWIFENMQREITRLTSLINNVLLFSRTERAGNAVAAAREPTELAPYLTEIIDGFAPLAAIKSPRMVTSLDKDLVVSIDRNAFRQAILNLLDNAMKYGPKGQTVSVAAEARNHIAEISVQDEGPGIPLDEHDKVWKPFTRGSDAVGTVAVGSGIGLSVVRDVVIAHGGSVRIAPWLKNGTRVVIELPRLNERG